MQPGYVDFEHLELINQIETNSSTLESVDSIS
jgi:hypothetical protein